MGFIAGGAAAGRHLWGACRTMARMQRRSFVQDKPGINEALGSRAQPAETTEPARLREPGFEQKR
ncbi:MAG: hypothetical protein ACFB50_00875 [Rubrobacteraceae bacterium]